MPAIKTEDLFSKKHAYKAQNGEKRETIMFIDQTCQSNAVVPLLKIKQLKYNVDQTGPEMGRCYYISSINLI